MSRSSVARLAARILVGFAVLAIGAPLSAGNGWANSQPDFASPEIINADRNDGAGTSDAPNQSDTSDASSDTPADTSVNADAGDTPTAEPAKEVEPASHEPASHESAAAPEPAATVAEEPAAKPADSAAPMTAAAVTVAPPAMIIDDVPGCTPGKMCIVCVAGCRGPRNGIIHAAPRAARH